MLQTQSANQTVPAGPFPTNTDDPGVNSMNRFGNQAASVGNALHGMNFTTAEAKGFIGQFAPNPQPFYSNYSSPFGSLAVGYGGYGGGTAIGVEGGPLVGVASVGSGIGFAGLGSDFVYPDILFDVNSFSGIQMVNEDLDTKNRKLESLIRFLMAKLSLGDTDAITTLMILISRKSRGTLVKAAKAMLSAMLQYDKEQERLTKQLQKIDFDPKNPDAARNQASAISMEMNSIAVARQMFMNQLRDVMTMSEEIGNVEKSMLDITGQYKRSYSRFNV